ncbi:MAG: mechanosensitive ion channel family protein [Muribaculaceae bacterium]|nr:mechanosensitive ion channel family protein [Muribaculaceae bacterium]
MPKPVSAYPDFSNYCTPMFYDEILSLLAGWGVDPAQLTLWSTILSASISVLIPWVVYVLLSRVVIPMLLKVTHYTEAKWDDILFNPQLLRVVAELVFVMILGAALPPSLSRFHTLFTIVQVGCRIAVVAAVIHMVNRLLLALYELLVANSSGRVTSLRGILQMLQIISISIGVIIVISILADKNPLTIITGLGAAATVLMLVFKDSIMGVVAGVQLTLNDMLRPGDWITVPSRNINGTVLEVGLTTVKVQNFDNTIVTVPPYSLVSESFQNWRGMTDSGGRRMNRSITIDVNSVGFCPREMIEALKTEEWGRRLDPDRQYVNLTLFRHYLEHYISTLPQLNSSPGMTCMVRELEPTNTGIPIDLYLFTTLTSWKPYEHFQASVMDHVFASVSRFGLRIYQAPSGLDVRERTPNILPR